MEPNHNGYQRKPTIEITVIAVVGLIGMFILSVADPKNTVIVSTVMSGIILTLIGQVISASNQKQQEELQKEQKRLTQQVVHHTNSIVEQLVAAAKAKGHDAGVLQEQKDEKARVAKRQEIDDPEEPVKVPYQCEKE